MKNRKFISVLVAVAMAAMVLTACGGSKETPAPAAAPAPAPVEETKAGTEAEAPEAEEADAADGEMVSDETFEMLQDNYALMTDAYNQVKDLYSMDEIAADEDIEEAMNAAADVINQMGEITQDSITEEDAVALNDIMGEVLDVLSSVVDGMEPAEGADGEMVSDETFAILQENYETMTQIYDTVAEAYNSDEVEADPEVEDALNQVYEIIGKMGEISQDSLTETEAVQLNDAMIEIVKVLDVVANAIG